MSQLRNKRATKFQTERLIGRENVTGGNRNNVMSVSQRTDGQNNIHQAAILAEYLVRDSKEFLVL